ncbi:MAG TPA: ester cyclase [Egibacteraceae bacterium]|jgi:predicted ester cyclase|nr:ester cyclase [Egibacteraceae bacterium]
MSNADALRQVIEKGFGQGDLDVADTFAAGKIKEHEYGAPDLTDGPELMRAMIHEARSALPDLVMSVEDIVADGDKVWARSVGRGTDPQTGRPVVLTVFDLCRFQNGRIVEHWGVPDRFALLHQAGLLGAPPA